MQYSLRTVTIVLGAAPPLLAATWFAATTQWSDSILLCIASVCAIPYWAGVVVVLATNTHRPSAWLIAGAAAILFVPCFVMSIMQLAFVIPLWSVLLSHGSDLGKPIAARNVCLALGLTLAFLCWIACVALIHG